MNRIKELRRIVGDKYTFNDLAKPVKEKEQARYLVIRKEFGLPVQK